jgi:hypothetical protein
MVVLTNKGLYNVHRTYYKAQLFILMRTDPRVPVRVVDRAAPYPAPGGKQHSYQHKGRRGVCD